MLPYLSIYLSILENVESAIVDKAKQSSKPNDRHLPMSCSLVRLKLEVEPSFAVQIRIPRNNHIRISLQVLEKACKELNRPHLQYIGVLWIKS